MGLMTDLKVVEEIGYLFLFLTADSFKVLLILSLLLTDDLNPPKVVILLVIPYPLPLLLETPLLSILLFNDGLLLRGI